MAITPLYTLEEINAEIAQAKLDLGKARRAVSIGKGTQLQVDRDKVKNLEAHLEWLQGQRMQLEGANSLQFIPGRVKRG